MKEEQIILKGLQQGSEQAYKDLFTAYFSDLVLYANHFILKSASNLNGNLNCSKELEHYAS